MEMKLTACLAVLTALFTHHLSPAIADHTTRGLNANSAAGFSLRLVSNQELSDHAIRRGGDGFLYLQHRRGAESVANVTTILPEMFPPHTLVYVGSGMGRQHVSLKVDPTARLTWLQCDPCSPVAPQSGPLFQPLNSPSFTLVHAQSLLCRRLFEPNLATGKCTFRLRRTGVAIDGTIARDNFLTSALVPDYLFGCSHATHTFTNGGTYAGVLALGQTPTSFAAQAAARGLPRFSYCLSARESNHRGFLHFGDAVPRRNPAGYRTTRILPALDAQDSAYYVSLVGVSLGARRLDRIHPEMFRRRKDGQGGCVVDVGTPLTVMVEEAYRIVEEALWADLERYGAERVKRVGYGLCVKATEVVKGRLPSLSLHFAEEEATLVISPEQVFLVMDDNETRQIACLGMAPGRNTVIGAMQQVDTRFIFDLKEDKLSFAPESCSQDTYEAS